MSPTFKSHSLTGAVLLSVVLLHGVGFGFTCPGTEAANTNSSGNYVLGMPMGGIGGGVNVTVHLHQSPPTKKENPYQ
jgi:hypothetical protein